MIFPPAASGSATSSIWNPAPIKSRSSPSGRAAGLPTRRMRGRASSSDASTRGTAGQAIVLRMAQQAAPQTRAIRRRMVRAQLAGRGIRSRRVLAAMAWVPREWFVLPPLLRQAYEDQPLPIGNGQTISQPYVVALMTVRLAPGRHDRVLEVGTGSGYQTAVLARLAAQVYTTERLPDLLVEAEERFRRLHLTN